jgi:hypothetical protein
VTCWCCRSKPRVLGQFLSQKGVGVGVTVEEPGKTRKVPTEKKQEAGGLPRRWEPLLQERDK